MRKLLWIGGSVLVLGFFFFLGWIVGYDIQYNRLGIVDILTITRYYLTCEKWFFSYNTPPCLNGHTDGWDLIPIALIFAGSALIIYDASIRLKVKGGIK